MLMLCTMTITGLRDYNVKICCVCYYDNSTGLRLHAVLMLCVLP